jgi:hypothetical protein
MNGKGKGNPGNRVRTYFTQCPDHSPRYRVWDFLNSNLFHPLRPKCPYPKLRLEPQNWERLTLAVVHPQVVALQARSCRVAQNRVAWRNHPRAPVPRSHDLKVPHPTRQSPKKRIHFIVKVYSTQRTSRDSLPLPGRTGHSPC